MRCILKLTTDKHEASRSLSATAELLVHHTVAQSFYFYQYQTPSRNSDGVNPLPAGALNTVGV